MGVQLEAPDVGPDTPQVDLDGTDNFSSYQEYNKVLRTWFVAFGIGGPALLLSNAETASRLAMTGQLLQVALAFLMGAAAQVVGALINKHANWFVYSGSLAAKETWPYKAACWVCGQFWFDMLLDLVTVASFGFAVWRLVLAFGGQAT